MPRARILTVSSIGVLALLLMFLLTDSAKLASVVSQASPFYLLLSMIISILALPLRALRWRSLLTPVKNRAGLGNLFWIVSSGLFINALLPVRIGEFARALLVKIREGVGFVEGLTSIVVERLLDLLVLASMGTLALFLAPLHLLLPGFLTEAPKIVGVLVAIVLGVIILGSRSQNVVLALASRLLNIFPKGWKSSLMKITVSALNGARSISSNPMRTFQIGLMTAGIWLLQYISNYFLFLAFDIKVDLLVLLLGTVIFVLSFILPAPPGYVGTYEAFWILIFAGLRVASTETLLAMAIVSHILTLALLVALGSFGTAFMGLSVKELLDARRYSLSSQ